MPETITSALSGATFASEADELAAVQGFDRDSTETLVAYLASGFELFSHSNRLIEGRVIPALLTEYANAGDVTAESEGLEGCLDISGDAKKSKFRKALLQRYELNGQDTCLAQSIINQRPAGLWLTQNISESIVRSSDHLSALEKITLFPVKGVSDYITVVPTTPAFRYPALLKAARTVAREAAQNDLDHHLAASTDTAKSKAGAAPTTLKDTIKKLPVRISSVTFQARSYKIPNPVNLSQQMSEAGGLVIQPVFVPPHGAKPFDKTVAGWGKDILSIGQLPAQAIDHVVKNAFKTSAVIRRLARQRQRHGLAKHDEQINNAHTRHAYRDYAVECASEFALLEDALIASVTTTEETDLLKAFFDNSGARERIYRAIENSAFNAIAQHYRITDDRSHFQKGFVLGSYGATTAAEPSPVKRQQSPSHRNATSEKTTPEGNFLTLRLSAHDVDLGSAHLCAGSLSFTAIHGLLHRVIERECGVSILRFYPVFHRVALNDLSHSKRGTSSTLWNADLKNWMDDANLTLDAYKPSFRTLAGARPKTPGVSGVAPSPKSAVGQPLFNEVKGNVELSIVVELADYLTGQQSTDLLTRLGRLLSASRIAGGEVVSAACRVHKEEPLLRGYSLMRVSPDLEETPLEAVMRSVAFSRTGYVGEFPIGAVHTGYQAITPATNATVKFGKEYPLVRAESTYHLFRYVQNAALSPDEREWFAPKITQHPTFNLTFCD